MGTFFVFVSIAPRVLIDGAGYSGLQFSLAFSTAALVMAATTRFAKTFVARWGIDGSIRRGMAIMLLGAATLAAARMAGESNFVTFVLPMWIMAVGIVFTVSVTANGALAPLSDRAGLAVALYFAGQSVTVSVFGTAAVVLLDGDTPWPLITYPAVMCVAVLGAMRLKR